VASEVGGTVLPHIRKGTTPARGQAPSFAPACSIFRRYLKGKGLKFTPERAMVLDAVLAEEGLFDAERVAANLRAQGHRGSRATIYRTLSHLHFAGILKQVFFDSTQTYYEVIAGRETSDYLVCVETGRVVEFNSPRVRELCDEICREFGFDPVSHQLQIFGVSREARVIAQDAENPTCCEPKG
jgi:Fur family ferric uptake transcriptional regulator